MAIQPPSNGAVIPAQEVIANVIAMAETKLQESRHLPWGQRVALENAHRHLYESLWWLNAADSAAGRIVAP